MGENNYIVFQTGCYLTLISKSMALISCQIAHSSKVLMPWSIIFDFSTSCTFTELYNSIKNGQSAPDGWTFPEKYNKCAVSAVVDLMKFFEKKEEASLPHPFLTKLALRT
jgi:hypothetical protein